jgi:hypothetical protein
MKSKILLVCIALSFFVKPYKSVAQINAQDSLALIDFYDSTGGNNWKSIHWDFNLSAEFWGGFNVDQVTHRVTYLDLHDQNLNGAIPASFGNLTGLISIDLSSNKLTSIPSSFGNLINLTDLELRNNLLAGPIPASFGNLTGLISLHLSYNKLTSIPSSFGNLINLAELDLESNLFTGQIPSYFGNLVNPIRIFLGENNFTGSIPDYFGSFKNLSTLYLNTTGLSGQIPIGLSNSGRMYTGGMYLDIGNSKYTFVDIEPFAKIIHEKYDSAAENYFFAYSPQANIPIIRHHEKLAVSSGGTLSNDTLRWYKSGNTLLATIIADTTYTPADTGRYSVTVTNAVARDLTLYSDPFMLNYFLADTSIAVTQGVSGTSAITINDGILKLATLTPTAGANALNGNVTTTVIIDTTVSIFNGQPYVQRHYDITPATNAENAQATVTLYFNQQEFDNFNSYVTTNNLSLPLMPTGGVNNGNVRIIQLHGSFTASPDPGNYNDSTTIFITPTVIWDNTNNWWVVTFPVTGFSGFFLSTANFTLPLTVLEFKGRSQENTVALQWLTTNEVLTKEFIIEHSSDGNAFNDIGKIISHSMRGINSYNFTDINPVAGNNFYRLKMIDIDGKFSFSNIVSIKIGDAAFKLSAYPNPANNNISTIVFNGAPAEKYVIEMTDQSGKIIKRINGISVAGTNKVNIDLHTCPKGIYFIKFTSDKMNRHSLRLDKQ